MITRDAPRTFNSKYPSKLGCHWLGTEPLKRNRNGSSVRGRQRLCFRGRASPPYLGIARVMSVGGHSTMFSPHCERSMAINMSESPIFEVRITTCETGSILRADRTRAGCQGGNSDPQGSCTRRADRLQHQRTKRGRHRPDPGVSRGCPGRGRAGQQLTPFVCGHEAPHRGPCAARRIKRGVRPGVSVPNSKGLMLRGP